MVKNNILLKLSGAALKDESSNDSNIFDTSKLADIAIQVKKLLSTNGVGIVIGGGNIWRGAMDVNNFLTNEGANNIGMLSTVMNGIAIADALLNEGIEAKLFSPFEIPKICFNSSNDKIKKFIANGGVAIFVNGTGYPYFTTDTCAALRALDINAKTIYMAKHGVDGVYTSDPKKDNNAKMFETLSFDEMFVKKLAVMDLTSGTLCSEKRIEIVVFNMDRKNSLVDAVNGKIPFTVIK